jgi:hypothetical protein
MVSPCLESAAVSAVSNAESLARNVFLFARFEIIWGFFFGLGPSGDLVCARSFQYLCQVLNPHKCRVDARNRPFCA